MARETKGQRERHDDRANEKGTPYTPEVQRQYRFNRELISVI